jgi:hypothetical protein
MQVGEIVYRLMACVATKDYELQIGEIVYSLTAWAALKSIKCNE